MQMTSPCPHLERTYNSSGDSMRGMPLRMVMAAVLSTARGNLRSDGNTAETNKACATPARSSGWKNATRGRISRHFRRQVALLLGASGTLRAFRACECWSFFPRDPRRSGAVAGCWLTPTLPRASRTHQAAAQPEPQATHAHRAHARISCTVCICSAWHESCSPHVASRASASSQHRLASDTFRPRAP